MGTPFALRFYNLANKNYEQAHIDYLKNNPRTDNLLKSIFSEKQTVKISDSKKDFNRWLLKRGQAPVILNEDKAKYSSEKIRNYYFNNGYFNAEVTYDIHLKIKKADINYKVIKKRRIISSPQHMAIFASVVDKGVAGVSDDDDALIVNRVVDALQTVFEASWSTSRTLSQIEPLLLIRIVCIAVISDGAEVRLDFFSAHLFSDVKHVAIIDAEILSVVAAAFD